MASALDALFGYGRYKCLGRSIAFMELNKSLPEVCLSPGLHGFEGAVD
jgi:hypothetical protein